MNSKCEVVYRVYAIKSTIFQCLKITLPPPYVSKSITYIFLGSIGILREIESMREREKEEERKREREGKKE